MSGAVAAHAAYNGSGTQGLAVTNKIHEDDGDVMSVFWNKNDTTRQLLYGSSIVEIPSSGASNVSLGGSRLFTVNNDIDCLGDMYLEVTASLPDYTEKSPATTLNNLPKPFSLQTFINRIEIQVGTQIWQTIENADLRVVNSTEMTADCFTETSVLTMPSLVDVPTTAWVVIPSLTKTLGPRFSKFTNQTEDGYPMAAAPHQSVKIKVYFRDEFPTNISTPVDLATTVSPGAVVAISEDVPIQFTVITSGTISAGGIIGDITPSKKGSVTACKLYAKQQIMCNEEREQMKAMPMGLPKRLKMTQNSYTSDLGSAVIKTIELDHFSLYASHLIISGNAGLTVKLAGAELKLNSSSYSGRLPGVLLDSCTSDSLGLYSNKYIYGDGTSTSDIKVDEFGLGTYVFPLAATAFGGSCVPLNRFDSVRLTLTFTEAPTSGSGTFINVTCVGETTALFKGGAASLAMY
tara:strand:+ start:1169 stop:2554 length:1386 start_codon:yes stop_codon:yes gene_type:complete